MTEALPTVWTIAALLRWTQGYFQERGIDSPRLDAELLLADALGVDRIFLYTHHDQPLREEERAAFRERVKRRAKREPVAYILGEREFYGQPIAVAPGVLIPRPETEHLVEVAVAWCTEQGLAAPRVLDIGTGSGAVVVALAHELNAATFVAADLSQAALAVARKNVEAHALGERVRLVESDLFAALSSERFDVIVSNPPYVETTASAELAPEVRDFEPHEALFAGADGLDVIRRLLTEAPTYLARPGLLAFELGSGQAEAVRTIAVAHGAYEDVDFTPDLQGHLRIFSAACR